MNRSVFKSRARYLGACSVLAMGAVLAATPAAAQDNSVGLEEVVVTARKVAENLQDVPVAVTAFSGEDLAKQNAVKVTDVGRLTPGITFRQSSTNASGLLVALRGQFQRDTTATLDPSVGTYVDGLYWARSYGLNADLVDLQSVQILKGPQGTLFGRNTTGGAVVLQTNDPKYDRIEGMVAGTFGRFNERTLTGVLNLPIVTDKVAVRGALQISQRDGYLRDIVTGEAFENRDNLTGRVKLGFRPTESLNIVLSAERFEFDQEGQTRSMVFLQPGSAAAVYIAEQGAIAGLTGPGFINYTASNRDQTATNSGPNQSISPLRDPSASTYTADTYAGTATLDTGIGVFKFIAGSRAVKGYSLLDLEGSPWNLHQSYNPQDLQQNSAELQLTGKTLNGALDYATGVFWFEEDGTDASISYQFLGGLTSSSAAVRSSAASMSHVTPFVRNKSKGAYAQGTWHVTDRLNVTGGLRYSEDDRGIDLAVHTTTPTGAFIACGLASLGAVRVGNACTPVTRDAHFSNWSYLASADYRLTDNVMGYIRFSKGYRSGGQSARATNAFTFQPFGPEIAHDVEVGFKSELFERRLRLNVAGYRSIIDGAQRTTRLIPAGSAAIQNIYGNAAKVRVWGAEIEATAILGGGFKATATGAITKPKYLSYADATGDRSGERFNAVPEEQASFLISYEREIAGAELDLRADYSWAGETALDEFNTPSNPFNAQIIAATTRPAGGEVNVRAGLTFEDGRYEIAAYGRNILDNRDLVAALQVVGFGYIGGQYREPATFGVQGTYRFGQ